MKSDLKSQVMSGMIWRFMERISAQVVTFVVAIILARLLDPSHYGVVSLTTIFITIANVFVTDGFGKALVQKKDADDIDFSSVFYFNFFFSFALYGIIFLFAPFIAEWYSEPMLTLTLRVLSLKLPLAAINSIQQAYVSRKMLFKLFFKSTMAGTIVSAIVGIAMAYSGFGVWALVAQYLTNSLIDTMVLWFTVKWRPVLKFDLGRLKIIIKFGGNILITGLMNSFYNNLRGLIIGRKYTGADLAFYTKGSHYPNLIVSNVNTSIGSVLYPAFTKLQDNKEKMKSALRKAITVSTFMIFPLMLGMFAVATDLVEFMLTSKWLPCVPYLQIACIFYAFYPINTANLQAIMAVGRSDIYLKLNLLKKGIGIALVFISMPFGIIYMAGSEIIVGFLAIITNVSANKKLLNYTFVELSVDIGKSGVLSVVMCILTILVQIPLKAICSHIALRLIIEVVFGGIVYLLLAILFKSEELKFLLSQVKRLRQRSAE